MPNFDDIILAVFPQLTTHLKHVKTGSSSQLFPYDGLIAVASVTYCRYTVKASMSQDLLGYFGVWFWATWHTIALTTGFNCTSTWFLLGDTFTTGSATI